MTEKRFELLSFNFRTHQAELWDNLDNTRLSLSIYDIIDLLNIISQKEFDFKKMKKEMKELFYEMISDVNDC